VKTLMKPDSPGKGTAPKRKWFRGLDSNQDNQIQSLVACQLADPGMGNRTARTHGRWPRLDSSPAALRRRSSYPKLRISASQRAARKHLGRGMRESSGLIRVSVRSRPHARPCSHALWVAVSAGTCVFSARPALNRAALARLLPATRFRSPQVSRARVPGHSMATRSAGHFRAAIPPAFGKELVGRAAARFVCETARSKAG
jgi:hypothetical protein